MSEKYYTILKSWDTTQKGDQVFTCGTWVKAKAGIPAIGDKFRRPIGPKPFTETERLDWMIENWAYTWKHITGEYGIISLRDGVSQKLPRTLFKTRRDEGHTKQINNQITS